jgi:SNF2 family DNA or RNA helicase
LRREKKQVAPELPEKIEQILYCDMDGPQEALYQEMLQKGRDEIARLELEGAKEGRIRMAGFTQLLRLRQICAEPRLVNDGLTDTDSCKLSAFAEILDEAVSGGHRILVFSQFVENLKLIRSFLEKEKIKFCYLDGQTRDRVELCERYNNDSSITVFLISLKAGGTGLNITGADTVVHFDPWWNPAVEDQATDRAHRIGQTRTVTSIKLIAANSVEEKVLLMQQQKSDLLRTLLEESEATNQKVSLTDIKELLN